MEAIHAARRTGPRMGPLSRNARSEERAAYLFLLPWLLGLLIFTGGPILASLAISLTSWNLLNPPQWVGLDNYREMVDDWNFWQSVKVTSAMSPCRCRSTWSPVSVWPLAEPQAAPFGSSALLFLPSILPAVYGGPLRDAVESRSRGRQLGPARPRRRRSAALVPQPDLGGALRRAGRTVGDRRRRHHLSGGFAEHQSPALRGGRHRRRRADPPLLGRHHSDADADAFLRVDHQPHRRFQVSTPPLSSAAAAAGPGESLLFYLLNLWNEAFRNGRLGYGSALGWVLIIVASIAIYILFRTADRWVYYETEPDKA